MTSIIFPLLLPFQNQGIVSVRNGAGRGEDFTPRPGPAWGAGHAIPSPPCPASYSGAPLVINRLSVVPPADRIFYGRDRVFRTIRELLAYVKLLTYAG